MKFLPQHGGVMLLKEHGLLLNRNRFKHHLRMVFKIL
jgi:hypothetical protein